MGRTNKVYINYGRDVGASLLAVKGADEIDLRILSAILLCADGEGCAHLSELEEALELDYADIAASVKYWKGAGIIGTAPSKGGQADPERDANPIRRCGVESYTTDELVAVLESNDRSGFIDAAQIALGRIFNKNEVAKLIGIADQLGFEEEAVLAILSYCTRIGKGSLSYAEKVALTFCDEEIFTASEVHSRIDALEKRNDAIEKIRSLYGFGGRALSATEKKLFTSWVEEFKFDIDIIRLAYDITVDSTQSAAPKYTNAILKKWHENGLGTLSEIEAYIESEKDKKQIAATSVRTQKKGGADKLTEKQAEVEDWFEQRLKQSFGE